MFISIYLNLLVIFSCFVCLLGSKLDFSVDLKKIFESPTSYQINGEWVCNHPYRRIINYVNSSIWHEHVSGFEYFAKFKFVKYDGKNVILFDDNRNLYVNITENELFWGDQENKIFNKLSTGKWEKYPSNKINKLPILTFNKNVIKTKIISSDTVTNVGYWEELKYCPNQTFAIGFKVRVQKYDKNYDNTGLNAIKLICNDNSKTLVSSHDGFWGDWSKEILCPNKTFLIGFKLRVDPIKPYSYDETSANSIRMFCNDESKTELIPTLEGKQGEWSSFKYCDNGLKICGIQVQQEPNRGRSIDDTSLNNVIFACC